MIEIEICIAQEDGHKFFFKKMISGALKKIGSCIYASDFLYPKRGEFRYLEIKNKPATERWYIVIGKEESVFFVKDPQDLSEQEVKFCANSYPVSTTLTAFYE